MSNDTAQEKLLQGLSRFSKRFTKGGDIAPIEDRDEWERLVRSQTPEEQELLTEVARFADLWRYLKERNVKLGPTVVKAIGDVHKLPVTSRAERVREINQELMRRIGELDLGSTQ